MTLFTIYLLVLSFQHITCKVMIEVIRIEAHHVEIPSVMLTVTSKTILVLHLRAGMVSFILVNK